MPIPLIGNNKAAMARGFLPGADRLIIGNLIQRVNSYLSKPVDLKPFTRAVKQLGLYWAVINKPAPVGA